MNLIALGDEQLGEIRAILSGNAGDESTLGHAASYWKRTKDGSVRAARKGGPLETVGGGC
jgi:hypothetical protein